MSEFASQLRSLLAKYRVGFQPPLNDDEMARQLSTVHASIPAITELYRVTNGLEKEWFRIFPLEDSNNPKKTWDSLLRANDATKTLYLRDHPELLDRFLVIASISGGNCAVLDRTDGHIWYQDQGLHQTDLDLLEFIRLELREVEELG